MKKESPRAKFVLNKDLTFRLDEKNQDSLDRLLRKTGATMPMIEAVLSRINKALAQDQGIQDAGNKTHEYRPDKRPRLWIYVSCFFICAFYVLNLIDYYLVKNFFLTFAGLGFMFTGLFILFLFIYKNAKITKPTSLVTVIHDPEKLAKIEHFLNDFLPDRNRKLKAYGLKIEIIDGATFELGYLEE
jgi:hypothetical protein